MTIGALSRESVWDTTPSLLGRAGWGKRVGHVVDDVVDVVGRPSGGLQSKLEGTSRVLLAGNGNRSLHVHTPRLMKAKILYGIIDSV